jgi:hypothetical protein
MALQSFTIQLPEELIEQLRAAGLADDAVFISHALAEGLARRQAETTYALEEMEAALEATCGVIDDTVGLSLTRSWQGADAL